MAQLGCSCQTSHVRDARESTLVTIQGESAGWRSQTRFSRICFDKGQHPALPGRPLHQQHQSVESSRSCADSTVDLELRLLVGCLSLPLYLLQALEAIARPYPALFCVSVVLEAVRAAAHSVRWGQHSPAPTLAELTSRVLQLNDASDGGPVFLGSGFCLRCAAAVSQQCLLAHSPHSRAIQALHAAQVQDHSSSCLAAASNTTGLSVQHVATQQANPFGFITPHAHQHSRQLQGPAPPLHIKQALLAGRSPFSLFPAQPSLQHG